MLIHGNSITYASSSLLEKAAFSTHGFLSRLGGVSAHPFSSLNFDARNGDIAANIEYNKALAGKVFGFDAERLVTPSQVHGSDVLVVDGSTQQEGTDITQSSADAIITNQCGIAIGVLTADCVPIMLADPVKKIIGVVHAGWRGTAKGIIQNTVAVMAKQFGSDRKTLLAAIGPSIGSCCYKVDETVARELGARGSDSGGNGFIVKEGAARKVDLKKANHAQLLKSGVLKQNISVENLCTSCRNDIFFSYRADNKKTGRQLSFIMIKEIK